MCIALVWQHQLHMNNFRFHFSVLVFLTSKQTTAKPWLSDIHYDQ